MRKYARAAALTALFGLFALLMSLPFFAMFSLELNPCKPADQRIVCREPR